MSISSEEGCDAGGGGDQPEKRGGMFYQMNQTDRSGRKSVWLLEKHEQVSQ